jgi:predicted amidohydrolase YtcJ
MPDNAQAASLALINGKIVTCGRHFALAQAVAVSGSRIVAVGTTAEVRRYV